MSRIRHTITFLDGRNPVTVEPGQGRVQVEGHDMFLGVHSPSGAAGAEKVVRYPISTLAAWASEPVGDATVVDLRKEA